MAFVIADAYRNTLLDNLLKVTSTPENWILRMYTNNYTPLTTSVAGSFSEANFTGYSSITLSRSSWGSASVSSHVATASYGTQTWTNSGSSQTLYGYYITGVSGTLILAEAFATPRTVNTGESISVTPTASL